MFVAWSGLLSWVQTTYVGRSLYIGSFCPAMTSLKCSHRCKNMIFKSIVILVWKFTVFYIDSFLWFVGKAVWKFSRTSSTGRIHRLKLWFTDQVIRMNELPYTALFFHYSIKYHHKTFMWSRSKESYTYLKRYIARIYTVLKTLENFCKLNLPTKLC